jgi:hypothetical protein
MPEFIVPMVAEIVGFWLRLTPSLVRDILADGIDIANSKDYEDITP